MNLAPRVESRALSRVQALLSDAAQKLAPIAGSNAALEARVLAAHAWGMTPEGLVLYGQDVRDAAALETLVARRMQAEPVAQIVGTKHFWKDVFAVNRHVLTPRADSETLIETLLRQRRDTTVPLRILDLGTGSGCLLLSALREYPQASGLGVDRSADALMVAQQNAQALDLQTRAAFVQSEWCATVEGGFDVVLANPPYIPQAEIATLAADVRDYEPHGALDGGADGLDCYRSIIAQLPNVLNTNALVLFEVGAGQAEMVAALGTQAGFTCAEIVPDLAGIERVVALNFERTSTTY